ncbi:arginase [Oceanithermus desulfurans NBRC 100063]|uniref:Arginase n=2 Tax=Oceanithermus desulfurans TaxID=227924 RepID=A0A511RH61_9DEIN|nr:arginase [Oceanithermus desulfurans NBRC 100063]
MQTLFFAFPSATIQAMKQAVIVGVPMDLGAGRRGVDMGPSAIRYARLHEAIRALDYTVLDLGDLEVPVVETLKKNGGAPGGLHHLEPIRSTCEALARELPILDDAALPVVLGGDHSISMGSVRGVQRGRTGLIWIDAHADFNTPETSPSGNIHGMPLAALLGYGDDRLVRIGGGAPLEPQDVVLVGVRSVDPGERELLQQAGVTVYTMKEIDRMGVPTVAANVIAQLERVERVHVSFDADVLDPTVAPGVGTPVPGGLTYREAHLLMELLSDAGIVTSLDLVEVNPILDEKNRTAEIVVELAASLLGKKIL